MKAMKIFVASAALALGMAAGADALTLTPADMIPRSLGAANCEPGCVNTVFGTTFTNADLLYKANVNGNDEGSFEEFYNTVFANTANDPSDATITWLGGTSITCPACYLAVKDGNRDPSYYFYDLAAWDGKETIELVGFWPQQGAISHVSIWGFEEDPDGDGDSDDVVPEPATMALFGLGLALAAGQVRKRMR